MENGKLRDTASAYAIFAFLYLIYGMYRIFDRNFILTINLELIVSNFRWVSFLSDVASVGYRVVVLLGISLVLYKLINVLRKSNEKTNKLLANIANVFTVFATIYLIYYIGDNVYRYVTVMLANPHLSVYQMVNFDILIGEIANNVFKVLVLFGFGAILRRL
ncbi:hypothetical protein [Oceanobacillus neutriphilus]|uniref:Uncharacterized protein n=1 Tax=Oceanobacillus neutriphilus TaxID=531815 RepID=A0ABQ2P3G5_9BACI|nr:hypothetical protein [Oceanobacillus neutriphilus]GGP16743.1 hypothetical protein GCM10011346_49960 [Oceanobacillus neutriphilus]